MEPERERVLAARPLIYHFKHLPQAPGKEAQAQSLPGCRALHLHLLVHIFVRVFVCALVCVCVCLCEYVYIYIYYSYMHICNILFCRFVDTHYPRTASVMPLLFVCLCGQLVTRVLCLVVRTGDSGALDMSPS